MNFSKRVFIFSLFAIAVIFPSPVSAIEAGAPAPDFTLPSIAGEEVRLSDFKGQLVLLRLATTWCPTCKQLSGEISRAGEVLAENNVAFLDVFVKDSVAAVKKYLADAGYPMTFHALLDDGQVFNGYNVYLIPRLLLVDADQVVRFDSAGRSVSADDIAAMVREYRPPAAAQGS
jgi:peroxiredoxin